MDGWPCMPAWCRGAAGWMGCRIVAAAAAMACMVPACRMHACMPHPIPSHLIPCHAISAHRQRGRGRLQRRRHELAGAARGPGHHRQGHVHTLLDDGGGHLVALRPGTYACAGAGDASARARRGDGMPMHACMHGIAPSCADGDVRAQATFYRTSASSKLMATPASRPLPAETCPLHHVKFRSNASTSQLAECLMAGLGQYMLRCLQACAAGSLLAHLLQDLHASLHAGDAALHQLTSGLQDIKMVQVIIKDFKIMLSWLRDQELPVAQRGRPVTSYRMGKKNYTRHLEPGGLTRTAPMTESIVLSTEASPASAAKAGAAPSSRAAEETRRASARELQVRVLRCITSRFIGSCACSTSCHACKLIGCTAC